MSCLPIIVIIGNILVDNNRTMFFQYRPTLLVKQMAQRRKRQSNKEKKQPTCTQTSSDSCKKLRLWSDESIVRAMEAVKNGEMDIFLVPTTYLNIHNYCPQVTLLLPNKQPATKTPESAATTCPTSHHHQ